MKPGIVIFHKDCVDGFTAAWIAWKKFGDAVDYLAAHYGDAPPNVRGRDVYVLDFSYSREVTEQMIKDAHSFILLDHHKSAAEALEGVPNCHFDMNRSGATMAWEYFHQGEPTPWLVQYVQDRDLWQWKLPGSQSVNALIRTMNFDFEEWDKFANSPLEDVQLDGDAILRFIDSYVRNSLPLARRVDFEVSTSLGRSIYNIPCVNTSPMLISEVVMSLAVNEPFAIGWFQRQDGKYQYSLRSTDPSIIDVSEIAKTFPGGGGHQQAAGFTLDKLII